MKVFHTKVVGIERAFPTIPHMTAFRIIKFLVPYCFIADLNEGQYLGGAVCDGLLCAGGECLDSDDVCDGWPQCQYMDDEAESLCTHYKPTNGN